MSNAWPSSARSEPGAKSRSTVSADAPAQLVSRIVAGEAKAEDELVVRYARPLRSLLRHRLRDAPEVDDLLQETLLLGLIKIRRGELRDAAKVGSYLMSLARNLAIDHLRGSRRRKTETDSEAVEDRAIQLPDSVGRLIASERSRLVRDLVGQLEVERDRQVILRFYLTEEDKASICEDLGLSSLHFNRVLHRARQRYRQLYEEQGQEA